MSFGKKMRLALGAITLTVILAVVAYNYYFVPWSLEKQLNRCGVSAVMFVTFPEIEEHQRICYPLYPEDDEDELVQSLAQLIKRVAEETGVVGVTKVQFERSALSDMTVSEMRSFAKQLCSQDQTVDDLYPSEEDRIY